jgi:hypothetical protein
MGSPNTAFAERRSSVYRDDKLMNWTSIAVTRLLTFFGDEFINSTFTRVPRLINT